MSQVITYSLRNGRERSDLYYHNISAFVDEVLQEGESHFGPLIQAFAAFQTASGRGTPRTPAEHLYEFLTLGVLWHVYAENALGLAALPRWLLASLARLRERSDRLKPGADWLRGILQAMFQSSRQRDVTTPPLNGALLENFLSWLAATGVFEEEVKRLTHWRDFLASQDAEHGNANLAAALGFAVWFEDRSAQVLGKYTQRVDQFLSESDARYRWRADAVFCRRKRIEYHLAMTGTEILNRAFRDDFLSTARKIALVPPCMREQSEENCQARITPFGAQCAHCTPSCRVHQITRLGDKAGFEVFILPDRLSVFSTAPKKAENMHGVGIVGVSCVLTNPAGGWETRALNVPAQGIPLDYCGCQWHWHPEGIPTDVNLSQLMRVLGLPAQVVT